MKSNFIEYIFLGTFANTVICGIGRCCPINYLQPKTETYKAANNVTWRVCISHLDISIQSWYSWLIWDLSLVQFFYSKPVAIESGVHQEKYQ